MTQYGGSMDARDARKDEESVLAAQERELAQTDRALAAADRERIAADSRTNRTDVAALAVEVGHLGAAVQDLHDLIMDSMVKSETASAAIEKAPTKRRLNSLVVSLLAVIGGLGLLGAYTVHQMKVQTEELQMVQFSVCQQRNAAELQTDLYLAQINASVTKAQKQGDVLALDLHDLLKPKFVKAVNCNLLTK